MTVLVLVGVPWLLSLLLVLALCRAAAAGECALVAAVEVASLEFAYALPAYDEGVHSL
jgi:hypothetical protein